MPLTRVDIHEVLDANGDVYFAMSDGTDIVPCRVLRPYLEALSDDPPDEIPSGVLFAGFRDIIEAAASIEFDLRPPQNDRTVVIGGSKASVDAR